MLDATMRRLIDPPLDRLARRIRGSGIHPNAVTLGGLALGLAAAGVLAAGWFWLALALLVLNRLADGMDGAIARQAGLSDFGGFLDIVCDFVVYASIPAGFALAHPDQNAAAAAVLLASFMGTASTFLGYAILAAKYGIGTQIRGAKSLYYLGGLTEGTETFGVFVLMLILPAWFPVLASIFAAACAVTAIARVVAAWGTFGAGRTGAPGDGSGAA